MAHNLIQSGVTSFINGSGIFLAYTQPNTSGNLLVAIYSNLDEAFPFSGIRDTNNNIWMSGSRGTNYSAFDDVRTDIWYAQNCTSGSNTVLAIQSGEGITVSQTLSIFEYNGIRKSGALDQAVGAGTNSTQFNTPTVTTNFANELLLYGSSRANFASNPAASGDWTVLTNYQANFNNQFVMFKNVTGVGNYFATGAYDGGEQWAGVLVTFVDEDTIVIPPQYPSGALKFYGSQLMQANSSGAIGSGINLSNSIEFTNPGLALNVNDRITAVSTSTADTGVIINLVGRGVEGLVYGDTITLNGTVTGTGSVTYRHVLRTFMPPHTGTITLTKLSGATGILVFQSGITGVNRPFFHAQKDQVSYDKIFVKNTSTNNAILNVFVTETSNPSGSFSFAIANAKDDTETISTSTTAPTGVGVFNNSAKFIPTHYLRTGEAIGVWIRASGQYFNAPYSLGAYGAIHNTGT